MPLQNKELKTSWTWEEWLASRAATRAITDKISPAPCRRAESSSDKRLRAAFDGERYPKPTSKDTLLDAKDGVK